MKRVLVTGGAGTLGAAVVRRLLGDPDYEVRVSDQRSAPAWMREGCEVHRGDLRVLSEARKAFSGCTHAIHLAGMVEGVESPHTLTEVNNALANAVLRAALDADVARFVYVSSSTVYEAATGVPEPRRSHLGNRGKRRRVDRHKPYKTRMRVTYKRGSKHRVHARIHFRRQGSKHVHRKTVSKRFTMCK